MTMISKKTLILNNPAENQNWFSAGLFNYSRTLFYVIHQSRHITDI